MVTAGSTLTCLVSHVDFDATAPSISVTDSGGANGYPLIQQAIINNRLTIGIYSRQNVSAGTYTATAVPSSGTAPNSFGRAFLIETAGVQNINYDPNGLASNTNVSSTTPTTGSTGTLTSANEMVFGILASGTSLAGATVPPTGGTTWITLFSDLTNASQNPTVFFYKHVTANTALNASLGTITTADYWAGVLASFIDTTAAGGSRQSILTLGVG